MAKKTESSHPMRNLTEAWLGKIDMALKVRDEVFGQYAEEAMQFFDGETNWMWRKENAMGVNGFLDKQGTMPTFRIQLNKIFDAVAIFGPALYAQNPNSLVSPILPPEVPPEALGISQQDPYGMQEYMQLAQQEAWAQEAKKACASVKSAYLNWIQRETDKKTEARRAITEALVAGVGYLETVMHQPPAGNIVHPRSRYIGWQDVVFDPDAQYYEDVQWMGIRRQLPVNKVETHFGYERGDLIGQHQSFASQTSKLGKKEPKQNRHGKSFDLLEYWDVYSKNGMGDLLFDGSDIPRKHKYDYSVLGDYCYLACARSIPQPLNIPQVVLESGDAEELLARVQWPIPYWYDDAGWPVSRLIFYEKPRSVWPTSLFKSVIGELRFASWCMSFLADKVASSCQTYVGILKEAGAEIQKQIAGKQCPFTVIEIARVIDKPLDQIISFLQAPQFSIDVWKMLAEVLDRIDKGTGLTDLIYGMTATSMRSATEANIKNQNIAIRPDDMSSRTEDWLSEVQVREIQAARWFCEAEDVAPAVGQLGALVWQNYVMTKPVTDVVMCYDYTVEAGSAKKPNKANKAQQLIELGQYMLPILQELALAGNVGPWNAYVADVAKNMDLDPSQYLLQAPDPSQQGPSPEEQEAQAEIQLKMAELEIKVQEMQVELGMEQKKLDQELEHEKEMHALDIQAKRDEMALRKDEAKVKLQVAKQVGSAKAKAARSNGKSRR